MSETVPAVVGYGRVGIPAALRQYVLNRDGHKCVYCGFPEFPSLRLHIDHVWPVRFGGPMEFWNLVAACPECNRSKRDRGWEWDLMQRNCSKIDILGTLLDPT